MLIAEPLYVLRLKPLSPGYLRGLVEFFPVTQFLYQLRVVALVLELLQGPFYLVSFIYYNSYHFCTVFSLSCVSWYRPGLTQCHTASLC